jgi:hypothetical protein
MGVNSTGGFLFIEKAANPTLSFPGKLNKFLLNGFKAVAERRKRNFAFSYGDQMFASYVACKKNFIIFHVQGRAALPAACPASHAIRYGLRRGIVNGLLSFYGLLCAHDFLVTDA